MAAEPIVYLVDDDHAVLDLLAGVVQSLGLKAVAHESAIDFLKSHHPPGPACLILDVRMPGMSGLDLQQRLVAAKDPMPIIFISGHADVPMAVEAMQKGAFFFLEKPFGMKELCDKIQEALRVAEERWQRRQEQEAALKKLAKLKPAERRVLDYVVAGNANKAIAETFGLSVRTIEVHRARLTRKLGVKAQADLLRLVQTSTGECCAKRNAEIETRKVESGKRKAEGGSRKTER
jgi:two-component system, LuxR family, response regulator FixJ